MTMAGSRALMLHIRPESIALLWYRDIPVGGDVGVGVSAFVAYEQVSCGDVAGQDGGNNLGVSFEGSRGFLSDRRLWRVPNVERGHSTTSRFSTLG